MFTELTHVTVLVDDADEAIDHYTEDFGFELRADETFTPGMRWVTVAPAGADAELVLQEPTEEAFGEEQAAAMRDLIGAGTMTVFAVDDCRATVETLRENGVEIPSPPEEVPWGLSAVVEDRYGNPYNLVESSEQVA